MKNLKIKYRFLSFLLLSVFFVSCEKDVTSENSLKNYIGMEPSKSLSIYPDETVSVESKVYASNTSNVDRTFNLVVDPASTHNSSYYSVPATVTIPAGEKVGTFQVSITGTDLGSGKNLIVGLEQIEGVDYAISSFTTDANGLASVVTSNKIKYTIEERCDYNKVVLSITFDNYPEETAWELYDSANNVIASGGLSEDGTTITGYADLGFADKSTFTTNFCLQSGTYTFVIYDDYGDGMYTSASVQGNYSLKLGSTTLASGSGNFGSFQDTTFTLP
ncbi:hypothetical protein GCM10011508_02230 [Flavobacterium lutivivi]|nr:hypothetical protein GCM10011508_02230 [Flavobacterium lutivivi]